ncbi:MAG: hypothetical protein RL662_189 [Bacteroidota bacterium]|jgi:nucleoid DNA-binding protein
MNEKRSLHDLVSILAQKASVTEKEADKFYKEFFQLILESVYENDFVKIKDFGTFKLVSVNNRESIDVNTGEKIQIPAHVKMSFTPDKNLRNLVNQPFAQFESVVLEDDITLDTTESTQKVKEEEKDKSQSLNSNITSKPVLAEDNLESINEFLDSIAKADFFSIDSVLDIDDKPIFDSVVSQHVEMEGVEKSFLPLIESEADISINSLNLDLKELTLDENVNLDETIDWTIYDVEDQSKNIEDEENLIPLTVPDEVVKPNRNLSKKQNRNRKKIKLKSSTSNKEGERVVKTIDKASGKRSIEKKHTTPPIISDDESIQEDSLQEDYVASYSNFEKNSVLTKVRQKLPIIVVVVALIAFGVYKFAELFDVTYDYEYYIGRTKRLALTDTLPYVNDPIQSDTDLNTYITLSNNADSLAAGKKESGDLLALQNAKDSINKLLADGQQAEITKVIIDRSAITETKKPSAEGSIVVENKKEPAQSKETQVTLPSIGDGRLITHSKTKRFDYKSAFVNRTRSVNKPLLANVQKPDSVKQASTDSTKMAQSNLKNGEEVNVDVIKLEKESGYDKLANKRSYKVSENLQFNIVNKAQHYIENQANDDGYGDIILE